MAQVKFLQGLQSSIDNILTELKKESPSLSVQQGAFYLTTDTDRLYYAQSSSELVPLNQFIRTVATTSALPAGSATIDGDYYYIKDINALAIYDHADGKWNQLNPDTNTELSPASGTALEISDTSVQNGAEIAMEVSDTNNHSATGAVKIVGGTDVTVTKNTSTNTITIASSDTTYDLDVTEVSTGLSTGESAAKITLDASSGTDSDVIIKSSSSLIDVDVDNSGNIVLTGSSQAVGSVSADFGNNGSFQVTVDGVDSTPITPTIKYGDSSTTLSSATFNGNAEATLDVYTTTQVDNKINTQLASFDAMKYEGTIYQSEVATKLTDTANWGIVYKAASAITSISPAAKIGDLIISKKAASDSVEGAAGGTAWDVVPSGDEQTINFPAVNTTTGKVSIDDGVDGAGIIVAAGNGISVAYSADSDNTLTATISQAAVTNAPFSYTGNGGNVTQTTGGATAASNAVKAITGITTDTYGNVTGVTQETITLKDSHAHPYTLEADVTAATGGGAKVTTTVTDTDAQYAAGDFIIKSNNSCLTIAPDANDTTGKTIAVSLDWGSF